MGPQGARASGSRAAALTEQVVAWRRHLHRNPELSHEERGTARFIAETLEGLGGLEIERPSDTGVVARLRTGRPGRTLAIRADIDALPIREESGVDYASERDGVMHACGHDGHAAMLLGAAAELAERAGELTGEVRFLFQPAEEVPPGGAELLVAGGALDGVDLVTGCHLWTPLPCGEVAVRPGPAMAAADFFTLAITGQGGHAAIPHTATDTVAVAAQVVANLQHVVARRVDPLRSAVLSVGTFHAGDAPNVLPGRAELSGTVRTFDPELRARMPELLEDVARGVTSAHGAGYELDYRMAYRPVVNDPEVAELVAGALAGVEGAALADLAPIMGGDDFSAYQAEVPGCYFFVGAGSEEAGAVWPHHHPRFRIDERALELGVRAHVRTALAALRR
jgi:amidohydrolase